MNSTSNPSRSQPHSADQAQRPGQLPAGVLSYVSLRSPRAKQREALDHLLGRKAFALLMAMRTGKTQVILDDFGRLEAIGEVSDLLIIAPAGAYRTWAGEAEKVIGLSLRPRLKIHVWETKRGKKHDAALKELMAYSCAGPRMLIMNIEAFSAVKDAREIARQFLLTTNAGAMIAVDESTTIKGYGTNRTKFVLSLASLAKYRRILSGLVAPRSFLDLFFQFYFLNPNILGNNYWLYRARYGVFEKISIIDRRTGVRKLQDILVGSRDVEEIQRLIAPHSFRVRLEDCYDLPESVYQMREVQLTKEQTKAYDELKKYATTKLANEAHVTATLVITQLIRLHQILLGHVKDDENGNINFLPEKRTEELLALLEDYDGKAIIWVAYDVDITRISSALMKEYGDNSVARFWGGNATTREADDRRFKEDERCRFMVATAGAGGRGRTWDVADLVIYHSNTDNLEHRDQSEERAKNVGKTKSVLYIDMMVPGTVEERIIKHLRQKINVASIINGDNYREWLI